MTFLAGDGAAPTTETTSDLHMILENANLLSYYEAFIENGFDDVTQLVDTCGEDFEEAVEAVGMASKRGHVRRLQRAVNDWEHERGIYAELFQRLSKPTKVDHIQR